MTRAAYTENDLISEAYYCLLRLPLTSGRRLRLQSALAALRDDIAAATGRTSEEVQNAYEKWAAVLWPLNDGEPV